MAKIPRESANKDDVKKLALQVGSVIAEKRKEMGLSQEKFAELVGCHRTYVGFTERGERNITIFTLRSFAMALDCTPSELLREAGI